MDLSKVCLLVLIQYMQFKRQPQHKKKCTLSVNIFSSKVLIGDTIFYVCYWRRDRHFARPCEPREGLPVCRAKEVPSFLGCFKTPSIGPARGIEPATSHSAVERSTDLANPAAQFWFVHKMQRTDLPLGSVHAQF